MSSALRRSRSRSWAASASTRWGNAPVLFTISVAFFIGCMFVDPIVVILILVPIFAPVVKSVGLDPVLVGTIITLQVAIGSATPPFGCDIFTAIAVFKRPYAEVIKGTPPFIAMLLCVGGADLSTRSRCSCVIWHSANRGAACSNGL